MENKYNLSEVFGETKSREVVMEEIIRSIAVYPVFRSLKEEYQEQFIQFCMGVRGVKMTYDTFFKHIFNPERNPERLSEMLSAIIGRKLIVKRALPLEHMRITEKGSLLILDIVVEFDTGELADVEIQKVGYMFPGQRASCYASDMIMRQYEREKSIKGDHFTYKDLKKVYTIVFVENSGKEFKAYPEHYIHRGKIQFDTGISLDFLQEFYFIPLDIFFAIQHNENEGTSMNELEAWLYFLGSDKPEDIMKLIHAHPRFKELYQEICQFRKNPEVAIMMFSEALRKLDENTVKYMIEEQKKELEENKKELEDNKKKLEDNKKKLEDNKKKLEDSKKELEDSKKELEDNKKKLEDSKKIMEEQQGEIERLRRMLAELKS